jgi:RNA polymerase sigma-70 factor (ECF subfamily)
MSNTFSAPTDDDASLIAACKKGELVAFEMLVRKHQRRMLNIALRITGSYEDACEVVQDAFVAAHGGIGSFRGAARFSTWLTSITVNQARNRLQQLNSRRHREPVSLNAPIATADGSMELDPPSPEPSAHERLEQRDVRRQVQECIGALPVDFREVLVLRDMEEFSYEEIGAMLHLAAGTVKSRLFRGREAIKDCLKRVMGEL